MTLKVLYFPMTKPQSYRTFLSEIHSIKDKYAKIIIHSASADASADLSADMPENRVIKLKILLKHSRML